MRPVRATTWTVGTAMMLTAALLAPAAAAPDGPAWEVDLEQGGSTMVYAVTAADGTVYVAGQKDRKETALLRAVDAGTGAVRWAVEPGTRMLTYVSEVEVDRRGDRLLIAGTGLVRREGKLRSPSTVQSWTADGKRLWSRSYPRGLRDLAVDGRTGQVCTVGSSSSGHRWSVRCWTRGGKEIFAHDVRSDAKAVDTVHLVIDPSTHRVILVGGRAYRADAVAVAWNARGKQLWQRTVRLTRGSHAPLNDLAYDPGRRWLYLLGKSGQRAVLRVLRLDGTTVLRRSYGRLASRRTGPARHLDLLPTSHRLALTEWPYPGSPAPAGSVRVISAKGRTVGTTSVQACCQLADTVVDPVTDRLLVVAGPEGDNEDIYSDEGSTALVVDNRGRRAGSVHLRAPGGRSFPDRAAVDAATHTLVVGSLGVTDTGTRGLVAGHPLP